MGGVEQNGIPARAAIFAGKNGPNGCSVFPCVSAFEILECRRLQLEEARFVAAHGESAILVKLRDGVFSEGRKFVHRPFAGFAVHNHAAPDADRLQHAPNRFAKFGLGHADELRRRPRRVEQRAEKVENCPLAAVGAQLARRHNVLKRRMVAGRKQEREIVIVQTRRHLLRREVGRDTQSGQHVGAAGLGGDRAVPVLGHGHAGCRGEDRDGGGDIEGPEFVAAGSADVEHLASARLVIERHRQRLVAQFNGKRRDPPRRLALGCQRSEKIGLGLGGDGLIGQATNGVAHLFIGQLRAIGQLLGQGLQHGRDNNRATATWPSADCSRLRFANSHGILGQA